MQTPVLIDLETRSACDLRKEGGYNYARHPSTRLMTVAWSADGGDSFAVWIPETGSPPPAVLLDTHLPGVRVYFGDTVPDELHGLSRRPWVAHNALSFDALVWEQCSEVQPVEWIDSYPHALSIGLPGGLDRIAKVLWGPDAGKDKAGKLVLHNAMKCDGVKDCEPENVPIVQRLLIAKYNVQDVRLLADLWRVLEREAFKQPEEEQAVLRLDKAINARGVRLSRPLIESLITLDVQAKEDAIKKIEKLTNGKLTATDLTKRNSVIDWLDFMGLGRWKSLKKDVVARWVDANGAEDGDGEDGIAIPDEEDEEFGAGITPPDLPRVARVLELRSTALRVTGGKLKAALASMADDDRARNLLVYWGAHTGRASGRRIQPHNFPRPKPGVSEWALLDLFHKTGRLDFDAVSALCDPSDAASALLRCILIPEEDEVFMAGDLSQIEARMLAYLAGDRPAMKLFWDGEDPYMVMAQKICGPKERWPDEGVPYKKHSYRQLVGKVPELACGYQGGERALVSYCAMLGFRMEDFGLTPLDGVLAYRRLHPAIAGEEKTYDGRVYFRGGLWDQYNDAAILACARGGPVPVGPVDFQREGKHLIVILPSGRRLTYRNAEVESQLRFGKEGPCVRFDHPRFGRKAGYPGLWAENIVQGSSRDVIMYGTLRTDAIGLPPVLHVHDEIGSSGKKERFDDFCSAISSCPPWLPDFPLDAECAYGIHYAKAAQFDEVKYRNGRER